MEAIEKHDMAHHQHECVPGCVEIPHKSLMRTGREFAARHGHDNRLSSSGAFACDSVMLRVDSELPTDGILRSQKQIVASAMLSNLTEPRVLQKNSQWHINHPSYLTLTPGKLLPDTTNALRGHCFQCPKPQAERCSRQIGALTKQTFNALLRMFRSHV